jgi:hypothetical protein
MALEAEVQMEQLGSSRWVARVHVRVIGRDSAQRAREFTASNYAALFSDITEFLDGVVPREATPVKPAKRGKAA